MRSTYYLCFIALVAACRIKNNYVNPDSNPDSATDTLIGPDGPKVGPIISGQFADQVIGQGDFDLSDSNGGGQSSSSLSGPLAVASDSGHLWIADGTNARVLQWNALPTVNRPVADVVIGQASGIASLNTTTQTTVRTGIEGIFAIGTRVFVADQHSNRVLIFTPIPTTNGAPAALVLGQGSFTTSAGGKSASTFNGPTDVWSDGTRLAVVDNANSRVLIWNSMPTQNGQPADIVLGRPDFGIGLGDQPLSPPSSASMKFPTSVWSNGTRLYVSDAANHRVLVWNTFPTTNGAAADFVLGQAGFDGSVPNAGAATANAIGLGRPHRAIEAEGALFISDTLNSRVVVHFPIPEATGEAADGVLGQDNLTTTEVPTVSAVNRMSSPRNIVADGNALYVPDHLWNRVTRYHLDP